MRKILIGLGLLIVILVVGVLAAPSFIPGSVYKEKIEEQASKALDRTVTITGEPKIQIFPAPAFKIDGLEISNAPNMTDAYFAKTGKAEIGVKLLPLFSQTVEITKFNLDAPTINLEKTASGEVNWLFGAAGAAPAKEDTPSSAPISGDINLGKVTLNDGAITYRDGVGKQTFTATDADIILTMTSLKKPLTLNGTMKLQDEPATLNATVTTPQDILDKKNATVSLDFKLAENLIDTDIALGAGELNYSGNVEVDAPTLRSLLSTLGMQISTQNGFDNMSINGKVSGTTSTMAFKDATVRFDEITGTGDVAFNWGGKKPKLDGTVKLDMMDLRPYLPEAIEQPASSSEFPPWSEAPMDFTMLKEIDVNLKTETEGILLPSMTFNRSALNIAIVNGELTADLQALNLYDGSGSGTLKVNGRLAKPTIGAKFNLGGLNAQAFAKDILKMDRLLGTGEVSFDLTTKGNTQAAMMRSLAGSGNFTVSDGAINGINIGKILRASSALIDGFDGSSLNPAAFTSAISEAQGPASATDFSQAKALFSISRGIVTSETIELFGPFFKVIGEGKVNLSSQSVDMTLTPSYTDQIDASEGDIRRIIPIQISGTFSAPKVGVDTKGIVSNLAASKGKAFLESKGIDTGDADNVEDLLKNSARDKLNDALGFGKKDDDAKEKTSKEDAIEKDASSDEDKASEEKESEEEEEEKSLEDELKEKALKSIFGG